jgi:hypothetical protein
MTFKRLSTSEMLSLSGPWTTPDHADRKILASSAAIAVLLPQIDDAHQSLLATQPSTAIPDRVTAIQQLQRRLDLRHDDVLRGCYLLPEALAYLTRDRALMGQLLHLQEALLPEGLLATQKSYREESDQAAKLATHLSDDHIALLQKLKTADGTLWDAVLEWEELGRKLGELEDELDELAVTAGATPADVLQARNKWIRTVYAFKTVLELVGVEKAGVLTILKRLTDAERRADRRVSLTGEIEEDEGEAGAEATGETGAKRPSGT